MRIRLTVLTERSREWEHCVSELRAAASELHPALLNDGTELFPWQTLAATWTLPSTAAGAKAISAGRLTRYLARATRKPKLHTSRASPNEDCGSAVIKPATVRLAIPNVGTALDAFTELTFSSVRANILRWKLIQFIMLGASDLYQGCEVVDLSLMGPDNRRPIDYHHRSGVLIALDMDPSTDLGAEELFVTSRVLPLRRDHPGAFRGPGADYRPMSLSTGHAVVLEHGYKDPETPVVIAVATQVQSGLNEEGRGDVELVLPNLRFHDILAGREYPDGATPLADILDSLPAALFIHQAN